MVSFDPTHHPSIGYIVENDLITSVLCDRMKEYNNVEVQTGRRVVTLDKSSTSWRGITLDNGIEIKTKLLVSVVMSCYPVSHDPVRLVQMGHNLTFDN